MATKTGSLWGFPCLQGPACWKDEDSNGLIPVHGQGVTVLLHLHSNEISLDWLDLLLYLVRDRYNLKYINTSTVFRKNSIERKEKKKKKGYLITNFRLVAYVHCLLNMPVGIMQWPFFVHVN
jgi:hypothetical protein